MFPGKYLSRMQRDQRMMGRFFERERLDNGIVRNKFLQ